MAFLLQGYINSLNQLNYLQFAYNLKCSIEIIDYKSQLKQQFCKMQQLLCPKDVKITEIQRLSQLQKTNLNPIKTRESWLQIEHYGLSNISSIIHLNQHDMSITIQTSISQINSDKSKTDSILFLNQLSQLNPIQFQLKQLPTKINIIDQQLKQQQIRQNLQIHQKNKTLQNKSCELLFFKPNHILFFTFIVVFTVFSGFYMNSMICLSFFKSQLLRQFYYEHSPNFKCPEHLVTYIWVGSVQIPSKYLEMIKNCPITTQILGNKQLDKYIAMWNQAEPNYIINPVKYKFEPKLKATFLRKVYLYFQSGIYSDFDTILDEQCYKNVISDEIVFTNSWGFNKYDNLYIPEQNFFMVRQKYNPHLKRWIISQIGQSQDGIGSRWEECNRRQCVILFCQHHRYDRTYWSKQYIDKLKE